MIEIKQVSLRIKKDEILRNVTVNFARGQIHGIIGRNGSGKTMLMKCVCGFIRPTSGQIFVDGEEIGKDRDFPKSLGCMIETPSFIPYYSGYRNLYYLAQLKNRLGRREIEEAMMRVGLDPHLKRQVRKYSLGMRQRLGLAQAIMENPDLLILDEPMNGLDKEGVSQMREYLLNLKEQGKTILLASHSTEDIDMLCDTVCEMEKGTLTVLRGMDEKKLEKR